MFTQGLLRDVLVPVLLLGLTAVVIAFFYHVLLRYLHRVQGMVHLRLEIRRHLAKPLRAASLAIGLRIVLPLLPHLPALLLDRMEQGVECAMVLCGGWLAIGGIHVAEAFILGHFDTTVSDNLHARRIHTQLQFFRRMLIAIALLLDAGALLWTLHDPRLWKFGTGLLASAGLVSLVMAAAAKSTASNLIAGMQIALTEPIRMDDVVVIKGEWGRIEELTNTYVVVRIWDERRLVVPLSYFIEEPFENWTRRSSHLLGTAFLYVDYSVPTERLREQLQRIVDASPLWDGQTCGLQVTNLTEHTVELRCLVSAVDSSRMFDLRCYIREEMLAYLAQHYPHALPTGRVMMETRGGRQSDAEASTG